MPETVLNKHGPRLFVDVDVFRPEPITDLTSIKARALVDTGATVSGISPTVVEKLALRSYAKKRLKSATEEKFVDYFLFRIGLNPDEASCALPFIFDDLDGFCWGRDADFDVVLGMDVIQQCDLLILRGKPARLVYGSGA